VGALVAAWGLRGGGRLPSAGEIERARAASAPGGLELRPDDTAVRTRPDLVIDEGGFGKGAGLDAALAAAGAVDGVEGAELDLGGQVGLLARGGEEIGIADPRRRDRAVATLRAGSGSVATSGNSERGLVVRGHRVGHLLDPRTGRPAPDFGSLTVWAPTGLEADCLSTGLYVLGPRKALAWAAAHPGVEVVVARPGADGIVKLTASAGLAGRLRPIEGRSQIELTK
jgi:thiamine biosynthesis lipoprotein